MIQYISSQIFKFHFLTLLQAKNKTDSKQFLMGRQKIYQKVNTFSRTPSLAQICSYCVVALQAIIFYLMIQPNIKSTSANIILNVLFSISLAVLIITTFICSYIDPSDTAMMQSKSGKKKQQYQFKFDINTLLYCQYCQAYVTGNAKHCRQCDRCVQDFDHHCMWINNCVGSKNYKVFIVMITSTCINLSIYIASVIVLSIQKQWVTFLGFIITCWVVLVIVFVLWFLLLNLNLLHIYLMCKGYTTYQFIVARKEEERQQQYQKAQKLARQKQQKLKEHLERARKRVSDINIQSDNYKISEQNLNNNKNPSDSQTPPKNSLQIEQESNSYIKMRQNKNNHSRTGKGFETTANVKINPIIDQNDNNVIFNGFGDQQHHENSQVESIKVDALSIKEDNLKINDKFVHINQNQRVETESQNQSIRISQFFIRNKSFNILLQSQAESPHKRLKNTSLQIQNPSKQLKQPKQLKSTKIKSKSSSTDTIVIKKIQEQLKRNKKK